MFSTTRLLRTHGIAITKTIGTPKSDICRDRESGEIVKSSIEHTGVRTETIRHTVYAMQILLSGLVIEWDTSFFLKKKKLIRSPKEIDNRIPDKNGEQLATD